MLDIIFGAFLSLFGIWVMKRMFVVLAFYWKRPNARRLAAKHQSGIYVKHGMTMDPKTGRLKSESSPTRYAYASKERG